MQIAFYNLQNTKLNAKKCRDEPSDMNLRKEPCSAWLAVGLHFMEAMF